MAEKELTAINLDLKVYPGVQMTAQDFAEMFEWGLSLPAAGSVLYGCAVSKASDTSISISSGWICHKGRLVRVNAGTATIADLVASRDADNPYYVYMKMNIETGTCTLAVDVSTPESTGSNSSGTGTYIFDLAEFTTNSSANIDTVTISRKVNSRRIYQGTGGPGSYGLNGDIYIQYPSN